ncbi:MAG: DNA topoisomerase IV subunit A [Spirochaetales bacterium]|nr:DNA topoisomerase IV subunit A [Spirochaetales bacterium]
MSQLKPLMERNFVEYASYVIVDRAIPDIRDGCKPVQRRILDTLMTIHDGKFHKVANVIGETMKLHPHGDASIRDALVVLANKEYFIEKQGNFGNVITGHNAAAPRYIECRLTPLARENLFNRQLTEYKPSYDGRKKEPVFLPAKLPVLLMLGAEGIAVGMTTKILPHNFIELLRAQVDILKKKQIEIYPDFFQGGLVDVSEYDDGAGRVRVRARIDTKGEKKLIIREIPYSTTTTNLINSIEAAVQKGKVSVGTISDFTTERVEIELHCSRGATVEDVLPQLFAYTECEMSVNSNIVVIRNNHPVEITVTQYLNEITAQLRNQIKAELELELAGLTERRHWLTLEHLFIVNKVYKRLEKAGSEEQLVAEVYEGMMGFSSLFIRPMTDDDVKRLLELKIRRISVYDIKKHKKETDDIVARIEECGEKLKSLTKTTISFLEGLIVRYADHYPRRTEITRFSTVDKKTVAKADIRMSYDPETGFFGTSIRGGVSSITVSEYDRVLVVTDDGTYRIMAPADKVLLTGRMLYCGIFDQEKGAVFTLVYRDDNKVAWGKQIHISKFITDKLYTLFPPSRYGILYFREKNTHDVLLLHFVKTKRSKLLEAEYDCSGLKTASNASRGTRLHAKPVARITIVKEKKKAADAKMTKKRSVEASRQKNKAKPSKTAQKPRKKRNGSTASRQKSRQSTKKAGTKKKMPAVKTKKTGKTTGSKKRKNL